MLRKYAILFGLIVAIILLLVAMSNYPGGSRNDQQSIGYSWKENYLSNLFGEKAINGQDNAGRVWAIGGMFFLAACFGLAFYRVSKKMPSRGVARLINYAGVGSMIAVFLTVTPLHDPMITVSSTCFLICMFYITVYLLKSRLLFMKIFSIFCMLVAYSCIFVYYTRIGLEFLPVIQKTALLVTIIWILCLEYGTTSADFEMKKTSIS